MGGFTIFPAIDLRGGRCVRLEQGAAERETIYDTDPLAVAERFREAGAGWVHIVDLDAAFGEGSNRTLIRDLVREVGLRVQTGGGLRSLEDVQEVLESGAARAVLGTAAVEQPKLVREAVRRWGADRIALGVDARGRKVASRGWRAEGGVDLFAFSSSIVDAGVRTLIYTDIERDGMFSGPNLATASELAQQAGAEVIVSGGVRSVADLIASAEAGASGVIVGKALYEGRVDLTEALARIRPAYNP